MKLGKTGDRVKVPYKQQNTHSLGVETMECGVDGRGEEDEVVHTFHIANDNHALQEDAVGIGEMVAVATIWTFLVLLSNVGQHVQGTHVVPFKMDYAPPDQWAVHPSNALTFGTGHAGVALSTAETVVFQHRLTPGESSQYALMNHFWSTCSPAAEATMVVRYYIDGETNASIAFEPPLAVGVGFDDGTAPWGTKWFGIGAGKGQGQAWFHNFKIPFRDSVRVTVQSTSSPVKDGFYIILRGGLFKNDPLVIGDVALPTSARLYLQKFAGPLQPLEVLDVASVPAGHSGLLFMSTLAVNNSGVGGLNFLEGCFHMYDPPTQPFPGTLLSTGTEDYYDSGWYFNAGEFRMPVSGFTHLKKEEGVTEWSAYRFHEQDPVRFQDGFRFTWRCGDQVSKDAGVGKCYTQTGGTTVGSPTCDWVQSYAWVYTWENQGENGKL
jgi:hypothetical protein